MYHPNSFKQLDFSAFSCSLSIALSSLCSVSAACVVESVGGGKSRYVVWSPIPTVLPVLSHTLHMALIAIATAIFLMLLGLRRGH